MAQLPPLPDLKPLLVVRRQTQKLLCCSLSKVIYLEELGLLTPIKLTGSRHAVVHHRLAQVEALARGETGTEPK